MELSRFGMIGTEKSCYWGLIGVQWVKPLPVWQVKPDNGTKPHNECEEGKPCLITMGEFELGFPGKDLDGKKVL